MSTTRAGLILFYSIAYLQYISVLSNGSSSPHLLEIFNCEPISWSSVGGSCLQSAQFESMFLWRSF